MKISVNIDENLLAEAKKLTEIENTSSLVRHAIEYLASYEAIKYLSTQGGTAPGLKLTPRRRMEVRK